MGGKNVQNLIFHLGLFWDPIKQAKGGEIQNSIFIYILNINKKNISFCFDLNNIEST